ncbi:uncharacterized protein LOC101851992 [Aplysia californica]|uniref:Uncharacterized protein LOC101851992 n=1 Tax=Aplysia californica TaxID=6500 RepID=A0ABM0ZUR9_APLCA|nr:uncharacterized protein LOC101851992 [Aplysia californica]
MLQEFIQKTAQAKAPEFAHFNSKVKKTLQTLFMLANIKKASFPRGQATFRFLGYEMGSISTDSALLLMKRLRAKGDPVEQVIMTLAQGINLAWVRAFELMKFRKVLPTVAGLPLEAQTDISVVTKLMGKVKTDVKNFFEKKQPIQTDLSLSPSISTAFTSMMAVDLRGYSRTGLGTRANVDAFAAWSSILNYLPSRASAKQEHEIEFIRELEQDDYSFLDVKSDIVLYRNSEVIPMHGSKKDFETCLPNIYTQMLGQSVCLSGVFHQDDSPHPSELFFLSSFYRMKGILRLQDLMLDRFLLRLTHKNIKSAETAKCAGSLTKMHFEGKGFELSRTVDFNVSMDETKNSLVISGSIPEASLHYHMERTSLSVPGISLKKICSRITQNGKLLSSFIFERKASERNESTELPVETMEGKEKLLHVNVSLGALSVDFSCSEQMPHKYYQAVDVFFKYYCEPQLGLLYALHPRPELAAAEGHLSTFSFHKQTNYSETPMTEIWKQFMRTYAYAPGHNITTDTALIADLKAADRVTDIYWIQDGNLTDEIHMDAHVRNRSDARLFLFDWTMHLENKQKFTIDLGGEASGPRAMPLADLTLHSNVTFRADEEVLLQRPKRSVLSSFGKLEHSFSEKASSMYQSAKLRLLTFLSRKSSDSSLVPNSIVDSDEQTGLLLNQTEGDVVFWKQPYWNLKTDASIKMIPHFADTPQGRKNVGAELQWFLNSSLPHTETQLLSFEGAIFNGQMKKMKMYVDDRIHDWTLNASAEHYSTKEVFHHHHNWSLVETTNHRLDRSFNIRVELVHFKSFDYDLTLKSPRTNVTHYIHYVKSSPIEHHVRAHARLHSVSPEFDLLYYESSDVNKGDITTQVNMTSTALDFKLDLEKKRSEEGIQASSDFQVDNHMSVLAGKRGLLTTLTLAKKRPPQCRWTYTATDGSKTRLQAQMMGPKRIEFDLQPIQTHCKDKSIYR